MLETNCSDVENKLNDSIKRLLIAFCEINVTFNTRLDIYGSVHVLSDNLEISSVLLNEHLFKRNGIRIDKSCENLMRGPTSTRVKKRVKQCTTTRIETPDEEEVLIEKEWNEPVPPAIVPDAASTSSSSIRKFNYSNQLMTSRSGGRSSKKCKILNDESANPLLNLFKSDLHEGSGFLSKFAQGKSMEENGSMQPLVNASLSSLLESSAKMDLRSDNFASFNSQSIFPEPELICMEGTSAKNISPSVLSGIKKNVKDDFKEQSDFSMEDKDKEERDFVKIKMESDLPDSESSRQISDHSTKHCGEGLTLDSLAGESSFSQIPDFMMNFLAASKLLRLNTMASNDLQENTEQAMKCLICSSTFSNSLLLQEHFKSHYDGGRHSSLNGNIPSLDIPDGPSSLLGSGSVDVVMPEANKLFCVVCNLTFRSLDGLKCHINSKHSLQKTYKCRFCPKLFLTRQAAYSHRVKFHSLSIAKK